MPPYEVRLTPYAIESLKGLPRPIRELVLRRVRWLGEHATEHRHMVYSGDLAGLCKAYVHRKDYRVVYELDHESEILWVHLVFPKKWKDKKLKSRLRAAGLIR